jgi:RIO-like serine/threonine protein kinase
MQVDQIKKNKKNVTLKFHTLKKNMLKKIKQNKIYITWSKKSSSPMPLSPEWPLVVVTLLLSFVDIL